MKIREGFVSNSSSSSYTCCLCSRTEVVYDGRRREAGFVSCINGHCVCEEELNDGPSWEEKLAWCKKEYPEEQWPETEQEDLSDQVVKEAWDENFGWDEVPEASCPVCCFEVIIDSDLHRYLQKLYGTPDSRVMEEVKKTNKRRKRIYDPEYVAFVCQEQGVNREALVHNIKKAFPTYKDFAKFIRS